CRRPVFDLVNLIAGVLCGELSGDFLCGVGDAGPVAALGQNGDQPAGACLPDAQPPLGGLRYTPEPPVGLASNDLCACHGSPPTSTGESGVWWAQSRAAL